MREDRSNTERDAGEYARMYSEEYIIEPDLSDAEGIDDPLPNWIKSTTLEDFAAEVEAVRASRGY